MFSYQSKNDGLPLLVCPGDGWIVFAIFEAEIATRLIYIHTEVRLAGSTQASDLQTTTNTKLADAQRRVVLLIQYNLLCKQPTPLSITTKHLPTT
jgi:hypothetical protein